jgi:Mg-chelatase subunit ChlI
MMTVCVVLLAAGCSAPPQKEIDQAQAAVDAARAAGADKYASDDFAAASSSLDKAREAVDQRDYRQALNYAIDSRRRAADATREATDGKARAKRDVDALYGATATRVNDLEGALKTAAAGGATQRTLRQPLAVLRTARTDLQKASAAITAGNYEDATRVLKEVRGKLDAAITAVKKIPPRPVRKRRR